MKHSLISPELEKYAAEFSTPETPVLAKLNRETHLKVVMPHMLSGHSQGLLLTMFSQMIQPRCILELGTFTGYTAICLAQGLVKEGVLHSIDTNEELYEMAQKYINDAGLAQKITLHTGKAVDIIPTIDDVFDIVFIDADKKNNATYYDMLFDKVRKGGFILIDNVLWSGKVLLDKHDKETAIIHSFNEKIKRDDRIEHLLLPIRDGLMIVRKK